MIRTARNKFVFLSIVAMVSFVLSSASHATTFTVDPSSTLDLTLYLGDPFAGGSNINANGVPAVTQLSGTLEVDVTKDASGNASNASFDPNPGSPISGTDWSINAPALGLTINTTGTGATVSGSAPVTGTTFDASLLSLIINAGTVDIPGVTTIDLSNPPVSGAGVGMGMITTATAANGGCTISFPMDFAEPVIADPAVFLRVQGTLTLVGDCCPVPEPSGLGLSLVSFAGLLFLGRRRR